MENEKTYNPVYEAYELLVKARDYEYVDAVDLMPVIDEAIGYLGEALE